MNFEAVSSHPQSNSESHHSKNASVFGSIFKDFAKMDDSHRKTAFTEALLLASADGDIDTFEELARIIQDTLGEITEQPAKTYIQQIYDTYDGLGPHN